MFRLIDRYLLREIIPYILLSVVLLTAIIFTHQANRFSEMLVVASRNGLPMHGLWRVMSALIPGILVFTLPISLLVGILVGQGRLSGDGEIVALGANGISRLQVLRPVMALASAVTLLMMYLTFSLLPVAVHNLKDLKANQALVFQGLNTQIKPRVFEEGIPHKVLYIEDIDRARDEWRNILLVDLADDTEQVKIFTAASGELRSVTRSEMPELHLAQGSVHQAGGRNPGSDRQKKGQSQANYTFNSFQEMTLGIEIAEQREPDAVKGDQRSPSELTWSELVAGVPAGTDYRNWLTEVHRRLSYPAACLVFALLGVGFGISNVRTGRPFGLIMGLAITVAYYLIALAGEHGAVSGKVPVWIGVWMANVVLGGLGIVVLFIQRRPGSDVLSGVSNLRHLLRKDASGLESDWVDPAGETGNSPEQNVGRPSRKRPGTRVPQLIDQLVISDLVRFFAYILGGFSTLFIIITLFQLLNQISRNRVEWSVVANYLFFLMPMVLNYMTPLAVLVAVMVTFGLLEKTSQVIALKASGQSVYRLAAPALLVSVILSAFVFLNQDYVLPFANRRQDNLRHLILSGQEPAQTFYQTDHKWIFGGDSRIYNYAHFDPTSNVFARLTLLELTKSPFAIRSRIFARRANWIPESRTWLLKDGWERRFEGDQVQYEAFEQRNLALPETPDYFKQDSRESSTMTLAELRQQIADLSRAGFDVLDLKVAFHSKIAFPTACLIMVFVGLPFAFSVGRRGALYGVALGIGIGLLYWGVLGLFEQMGRYEILPPVLAAWGPNVMFGTGGLYLFFTSRT
jgi:LPS export ABC transporter permease LptG/LPS export ABC transporter permease LptF